MAVEKEATVNKAAPDRSRGNVGTGMLQMGRFFTAWPPIELTGTGRVFMKPKAGVRNRRGVGGQQWSVHREVGMKTGQQVVLLSRWGAWAE